MILFGVLAVFTIAFAGVLLVGAPYLPTLTPQIKTAFTLLGLKNGQTLLELGCGDGKVLIAAAARGYKAVGIELNPFLALIAWLRTRKYRAQVRVIWGNYWDVPWPKADGVYVFLLDRFMPRLDARMQTYGGPLASMTFEIPGKQAKKADNGVFLYDYRR